MERFLVFPLRDLLPILIICYSFCFALIACENEPSNQESATTMLPIEAPEEEPSEQGSMASEDFLGPHCEELEIPSWERRVGRLARDLCANCHNDNFAWLGIKLHTYEDFVQNGSIAIERIRAGDFSFRINILEINAFIAWYEADMPQTEKDCI